MKEAKDMKEGWEYKKLGEVADFYRGLTYGKQDEAISSDVCVLRSNNIDMESMSLNFDEIKYLSPDFVIPEDKKLKGNSIFICMSNGSKQHVGKVAFVENDMDYAFGGFMGLITPSKEVSAKYVYYACRSPLYRVFLTSIGNGIGITNLKFTDLYNFSFPMPKLSHQQQIVSELDLLSGVIEKQKTQLEELDKLAQSIFYDMFGDPVTNEKGWNVLTINDCSLKFSDGPFGSNLKSSHYHNEGVRVIRLQNIGVNEFVDIDKAYITESHYKTLEKYTCYPGDVVIGTLGSPNLRACIIPQSIDKCINKADCVMCRVNNKIANAIYVCSLLNCESLVKAACVLSHGETRTRISAGQLKDYKIPFPPLSLQQEFAAKVEAIEAMKAKVRQSLKEAETLFNSRMDYYFN